MKLKNSYILLIVMSIFLLVSIGSACAQEIGASDAGILANERTDVTPTDDTVEKIDTTVESENVKINEKDPVEVPITVKDNESNAIPIVKSNITVNEGNKSINFNYNNSKIIITDKLANGNHSLIINYLGNDVYKNSTSKIILSIFGNYSLVAPSSVNVNSSKIVEVPLNITNSVDIEAVTSNDFSVTITYNEGNATKTITAENLEYINNKLKFSYTLANNITTSNMTVVYNGAVGNFTKKIKLNRIYNVKIEGLVTENQYQNGAFEFKITDVDDNTTSLDGKKVSLYTVGNIRAGFSATITGNIAKFPTKNLYEFDQSSGTFSMKQLEVGNHAVDIQVSDQLKGTTLKVNLTIIKADINIKIDNFKEEYGTKKNVTITVTSKKDGSAVPGIVLHLYMPQTSGKNYYFQTDSNGQSKISVTNLVGGTYNITVNNNDTKNINNAKAVNTITITPKAAIIVAKNTVVYYNTGSSSTIVIKDKKTGAVVPGAIVLIQLYTGKTSKNYLFQANNKGVVTFSASLSVGKHKMIIQTADTRYSAPTVTKYITVKKANAKIFAPRVVTYYKGTKYFTVGLKNTNANKPIYDAKINIKVFVSSNRYYNYVGNTGSNGQIRLSLDNLNPGTYRVIVAKGESQNYTASQITSQIVIVKAPTVLTPYKVVAKKGTNTYFKVVAKNTKTKKVITGLAIKVKVFTGSKYKIYTVKTSSKGVALLNVKTLSVGLHKVVISSGNKYCVAKSKASTIKITK
ncbi:hypothetical protein [uncultured Methanobrevibacter sp.]|uniref:hypothetical protein n=1 Tax=uncultured Methanobrevibacter sp. TaxID=253161 RepID=UPI00260110B8|nr:hypothetical protein [uncultured Methanobrevibacter sp.]